MLHHMPMLVAVCVVASPFVLGANCNPPSLGPKPVVYAVTPTEAATGQKVWIEGRNLDNTNFAPRIVDPHNINVLYPEVTVLSRTPHQLKALVPGGLGLRKKFWLWMVPAGNRLQASAETVPGKAHSVFLRASGPAPSSERVKYALHQAAWMFTCDMDGFNCMWPYAHEMVPLDILCDGQNPMTWDVQPWKDYRKFIDQSSRDWATMCSEAWQWPTTHSRRMKPGFTESYRREELIWNPWFWLETAPDMPYQWPGAYWTGSGPLRSMATGNVPYIPEGHQGPLTVCFNPWNECLFSGTRQDAVTIFFVGAFDWYGNEVDPNNPITGFRAFTGPSWWPLVNDFALGEPCCTDTHGLMLISSSRYRGYFPRPALATGGGGSIWPLLAAVLACDTETCWPGPGYETDTTPNLLSHELVHALLDRGDYPFSPLDVEDTPFVQNDKDDGGIARRGFNLYVPAIGATPRSECTVARSGSGKDFTH